MHELSCTWVPGTTNVVRLRFNGRTIEMTSTRLSRIFGPKVLGDLYLRGRAVLRADAVQLAQLT
ncbi:MULTISPECIES: hypothetical protein [Deinococcus]|uniref:SCP2 domain-containing protein n=1 Tax=Deinococcus rufus TaxID=2136097 RepID=A0ABV7ZAG9_9DEIO|nr:hypothetical protein [Deinococcus sp. AB2017081]WQE94915.1 hypothetical protein U2P90_16220 [Deinococcus sp. AB2017081]